MMLNELRYNARDFNHLDIDDIIIVLNGYVYPVYVNDTSEENYKSNINLLHMLCNRFPGLYNTIFDEGTKQLREIYEENISDAFWNFVDLPKILVGIVEEGDKGLVIDFMSNSYDIKNSKELFAFARTEMINLFDEIKINEEPVDLNGMPQKKSDLQNIPIANPLYHGTSIKFAYEILTKGLKSVPENSTFSVQNKGYVFLTSDFTIAKDYAARNGGKRYSDKCVVKINSNNINKDNIVLDYDFAISHTDDFAQSPYHIDDESRERYFKGNVASNSKQYGTKFAKIGYKGIIMPNAIEGIYVATLGKSDYQYYTREEYLNKVKQESVEESRVCGNCINEVDSSEVSLSSFKIKSELNPKFWVNDKLNSRVRLRLLDIADDFIDELTIKWVKPEDIVLTGSIANYNWSKYSDVDLHIMVDYTKVYKNKDFVKDYFDSKKEIWSKTHPNLTIYGFPVEVYVEDSGEENNSSGVYSLNKNKWIKEPDDFQNATINSSYVKKISAKIMTDIDDAVKKIKKEKDEHKIDVQSEKLKKIFDRMKKLRVEGLKNGGEMSSGNIIWKILRRSGYIDKLWDFVNHSYDKINSLNEKRN